MRVRVAFVVAMGVLLPAAARAAARPHVHVRVDATLDTTAAARLGSAIEAQVRDVADVVGQDDGGAIVVRVSRTSDGVVVTLVDASGATLGRPRVLTGDDEVVASSAGAIVRAHVVAAETAAPPPRAPEAPAPAPRPASPPVPAARDAAPATPRSEAAPHLAPGTVRFGAYYTGATFAPELAWQSGVRLEGSVRASRLAYVGVGYALSPGVTLSGAGADVRVTRHSAAAFVGLESTGLPFALAVDVGAGLDVMLRSTTATSASLAATGSATHPSPLLALRAHGRLRAPGGSGLALDVAPTFEAAPGGRSLVVSDGTTTELLVPNEARFRLDVGGTFDGF